MINHKAVIELNPGLLSVPGQSPGPGRKIFGYSRAGSGLSRRPARMWRGYNQKGCAHAMAAGNHAPPVSALAHSLIARIALKRTARSRATNVSSTRRRARAVKNY
jgi:hypothetical protein